MKLQVIVLVSLGMALFNGCQDSSQETKNEEVQISETKDPKDIKGTWTLVEELHKDGKKVVWEGRPTVPEMTFKENGYFLFVDRITDEEMKSEGIATIQDRYKGQYELKDKKLTLNHYQADSLITEIFDVEMISEDELVINDKEHGHTIKLKR
jgi:hypothetical protein